MQNVEQSDKCRTKGGKNNAKNPTFTCWIFVLNQLVNGARSRNRTGTGCLAPTDFKSVVSTYFTIRAILA